MEDELLRAFKYAGFNRKMDPAKMIQSLMRNLEMSMLRQMQARLRARMDELDHQHEVDPIESDMDPFVILGVAPNSTREEVDRAYRDRARQVHPDIGGSNEEMAKVNAAYEAIRIFRGWKVK